jgi:hypothetical protein
MSRLAKKTQKIVFYAVLDGTTGGLFLLIWLGFV